MLSDIVPDSVAVTVTGWPSGTCGLGAADKLTVRVSSSVTVTARLAVSPAYPPPEAVCSSVAASFAPSSSSPAETVTVRAVLQRSDPLGLNVRLVSSKVRSVPVVPVMATVTVAEGCVAKLTV